MAYPTITSIQDKQIKEELRAIAKHGKNGAANKAIFAARTRAKNALIRLGFSYQEATQAVTDAADMVFLHMESN